MPMPNVNEMVFNTNTRYQNILVEVNTSGSNIFFSAAQLWTFRLSKTLWVRTKKLEVQDYARKLNCRFVKTKPAPWEKETSKWEQDVYYVIPKSHFIPPNVLYPGWYELHKEESDATEQDGQPAREDPAVGVSGERQDGSTGRAG